MGLFMPEVFCDELARLSLQIKFSCFSLLSGWFGSWSRWVTVGFVPSHCRWRADEPPAAIDIELHMLSLTSTYICTGGKEKQCTFRLCIREGHTQSLLWEGGLRFCSAREYIQGPFLLFKLAVGERTGQVFEIQRSKH